MRLVARFPVDTACQVNPDFWSAELTINGTTYHRHDNGGGWVANTANVAPTAFVGVHAMVYGQAAIRDHAKVYGLAQVFAHAIICDHAEVFGYAAVCDHAVVGNHAKVYGFAQVCDNAIVRGHAEVFSYAVVSGDAIVRGKTIIDGGRICGYESESDD